MLTDFYRHVPLGPFAEYLVRRQLHFRPIDRLLKTVSLAGCEILELGSGAANNSLHLSRTHKVKSVTLLDFCREALDRVAVGSYVCPVIRVRQDILTFLADRHYDFVHSTGLVEHFIGRDRLFAVKKHSECARPGGLVMIWVPVLSPTFSLIGKINTCLGIKEIPFAPDELRSMCEESDLTIIREERAALGCLHGVLAEKNP